MTTFGMILLVCGAVGLVWGAMQRFKAARMASAPFVKTGETAGISMAMGS